MQEMELFSKQLFLCTAILVSDVCISTITASRSDCSNPLGLENGTIANSQLSSYTHHDSWDAFKARLNNDKAWCSGTNDNWKEYLQIDLLKIKHVSAIATQGVKTYLSFITYSYYVETFMIKYSYDGRRWFYYEESNGADVIFTGNSDANNIRKNYFRDTFVTRFLRIYPKQFHRDMCLRVELYGCNDQADNCSTLITNPSGSIASPRYPGNYPANTDCTWLVSVSGNRKISLMFTQFDVYQGANPKSCSDDFLEVRSGLTDISPQIGGKYCNRNRTLLITTRGNMVRIYFHSGSASLAHKGFQIHFLSVISGSDDVFAVKACDSNMLALNCSSYDFTINILHAWYHLGSFPHSCGQQHTTTVSSCPAFDAKNKVVSKCQDYRECRIPVSESLSGESCPSAARQLEVFYQCTSRNLKTPVPAPTSPPTTQRSTIAPSTAPPITTNTQSSHSLPGNTTESPTQIMIPSTKPIVTVPTTTPSQVAFVGTDALVSVTQGTTAPPLFGVEARTGAGMAAGTVGIVVATIIAVIIVLLLVALLLYRKKRKRKEKGDRLKVEYIPEREYSVPNNSAGQKCPLNYGRSRNAYETVNILYQSADSSTAPSNSNGEDGNSYASCAVPGSLPKVTENPIYNGVCPPFANGTNAEGSERGYDKVKPPPHEHESPSDNTVKKIKSIDNPNYEQTLPFMSHEYAVPDVSKC